MVFEKRLTPAGPGENACVSVVPLFRGIETLLLLAATLIGDKYGAYPAGSPDMPLTAALMADGTIKPLNHRFSLKQAPLRQSVIGACLYLLVGLMAPQLPEATWKP